MLCPEAVIPLQREQENQRLAPENEFNVGRPARLIRKKKTPPMAAVIRELQQVQAQVTTPHAIGTQILAAIAARPKRARP